MIVINLTPQDTWAIAAAAFSSPMYLSAPLGNTANEQATGFNLQGATAVVVAFEGTYSGQVLAHEQTLDPTGGEGWFSVMGAPATGGSSTSSGSTSGTAYIFPAMGVLHRMRMTGLSSGTIEARVLLTGTGAGGGSVGGGGGGGSLGMTTTAAAPSYAEGATGQALSGNLSGQLRTLASATDTLLSTINTSLNTPATALPPPVPQGTGDTTFEKIVVNISTATTTELKAAVASQKTRVHKGFLVVGGANVLTFKRGSTAISGPLTFGSSGGFIYFNDDVYPEMTETAANEALNLTTTTTAAVGGVIQTKTSA